MAHAQRRRLKDIEIEDILNDSEIDGLSDDESDDPEYIPVTVSPIESSVSSDSDSDDESVTVSSSRGGRGRSGRGRGGRGRGRGRGSKDSGRTGEADCGRGRGRGGRRGRGRGRGVISREDNTGSKSPTNVSTDTITNISTDVEGNNWVSMDFQGRDRNLLQPAYLPIDSSKFDNIDYFKQYINDDLIDLIVEKSNQTAIEKTGRSLNLIREELYVYLGITMLMATLNFPQIRMYWECKWRVAMIADNMTRNRFFLLRSSLKIVFDNDISSDTKAHDRLWKMRPLIDRIQAGCQAQPKEQYLSIDEMIIPFSGSCSMKQYCPGKPNPVGLKTFVLANPNGTICDFHVYQGPSTYPSYENTCYGLGEKAVLSLADGLVPGHILYFDRYFTSEKLIDALESKGIGGTGTVMKNRIPAAIRGKIMDDKHLKNQGRGSSQVLVRNDNLLAVTKWYDNKGVVFMSSAEGNLEQDECRRWCKKNKSYVSVPRPKVVKNYNQFMGGVDVADRLLAVCPFRYRTKKWTHRFMSHMIDLAVSNSWLQYRGDMINKQIPVKKIMQLRSFKIELAEVLIEANILTCSEAEINNYDGAQVTPPVKRRGKPTNPLPSKRFRVHEARHMPQITANVKRCRQCHYNRTLFKCDACDISLCLTRNRNCFFDFHQDDD